MITLLIIATTGLVSYLAFSNPKLMNSLDLQPFRIIENKEYLRILTHVFTHADWMHLIVNMLVFWSFGSFIEHQFFQFQEDGIIYSGTLHFIVLYFGGACFSIIDTLVKQRKNIYYHGVGASGAVSAILFASIFFQPWQKIYFFGILPIPGVIFALLYMVYSYYMDKKNIDNTNHNAHFYGAFFGLLYPIVMEPSFLNFFIDRLLNPF